MNGIRDRGAADVSELSACHHGLGVVKLVITDGAPGTVEEDLDSSCGKPVDIDAAGKPQVALHCTSAPDESVGTASFIEKLDGVAKTENKRR